jgi:hypothetical protein
MTRSKNPSQLDMFAPKPPVPTAHPIPMSVVPIPVVMAQPKHEGPTIPNNPPPKQDLRKRTEAWILKNPEVAKMFLRFAQELASRGRPFGVGLLTERVRYECAISTGGEKFKISNNYRAYIARWLIAQDPSLEEFLSFREVQY